MWLTIQHSLIGSATTPLTQTIVERWTEPTSILAVLSLLTLILFYVCWYLLRLYIRKTEDAQKVMIELKKEYDSEQREIQLALRNQLKENTEAITELTTLIRERLVKS